MKNLNFPIFKTKSDVYKKFDLTDGKSRQEYFEYKAGPEIQKLQDYLKNNTFIVYLLGKKSSGKGTYSKMLKEIVAPDRIEHFSVGDMFRSFDKIIADPRQKEELIKFLHEKYRGPVSVDDIIKAMESRSTKNLLPSELMLALTEREISKLGKKAIFIDGFPRDVDQVNYSLFFKVLIDYRQDPDIFALIDVPTNVIDERVKYRVICPICQTARNTRLLATKHIGFDRAAKQFYLLCDNPDCPGHGKSRMVTKEGDEQGIAPIKERLDKDELLIEQVDKMHGLKKIYLRNSIPVDIVAENYDDYEITPGYEYQRAENGEITVAEKPWEVKDDKGVVCNSLMPPPVVISLIKQLVQALGL